MACCSSVWFRSIVGRNWFQDEPKVASGLQRFQDGLRCRRIRTVVEEAAIDQRHGGAAVVDAERHQDLILKVPTVAFLVG